MTVNEEEWEQMKASEQYTMYVKLAQRLDALENQIIDIELETWKNTAQLNILQHNSGVNKEGKL